MTDRECFHEEKFTSIEQRLSRLDRSWFGNGSTGAMEEIIKLRTAVKIMSWIGGVLTIAVVAQIVEAIVKK